MSFMMHPYPYSDSNAVNPVTPPDSVQKNLVTGIFSVAKKIASLFGEGKETIGLDAYPGAETSMLVNVLRQ